MLKKNLYPLRLALVVFTVVKSVVFCERITAGESVTNIQTAVITGSVRGVASQEPIAGAVIRVAVPATDMRNIQSADFQAVTDKLGHYKLAVPVSVPVTKASLDALAEGFGSLAGSLMSGGVIAEVELSPSATVTFDIQLKPALYVAGILVNEREVPISGAKITATLNGSDGYGYITVMNSKREGGFQIFDYPLEKSANDKGGLVFEHPQYRRTEIKDVYAVPSEKRRSMRIVMAEGSTVKGYLVSAEGKRLPGLMIEANFEDANERKATMTDSEGRFAMSGLPKTNCTLVAHAKSIHQKIRQPVLLNNDMDLSELRLSPVQTKMIAAPVTVLGMELADLNPSLKTIYDLTDDQGVVVLKPGDRLARLNIGSLSEGDCFWMVGDTRVKSISELVKELLRNVQLRRDKSGICRVVYSFKRVNFVGTNTQYAELSEEDLAELEQLSKRLSAIPAKTSDLAR